VRILNLGLLLHRGSGLPGPDAASWESLVDRIVASFGRPAGGDDARPPTPTLDPTLDPDLDLDPDRTTGAPEDPR
jgi:hypothetical protein